MCRLHEIQLKYIGAKVLEKKEARELWGRINLEERFEEIYKILKSYEREINNITDFNDSNSQKLINEIYSKVVKIF